MGKKKVNLICWKLIALGIKKFFNFQSTLLLQLSLKDLKTLDSRNFGLKKTALIFGHIFVWSINNPVELSTALLETNIEMYFNGLINYQNSVALFTKKEPSANANKYIGKLKTFDALVAKSNMTLNITAEYFYCNQFRKTYILFRFSPQDFVHDIWTKLASVTLRKGFCDL